MFLGVFSDLHPRIEFPTNAPNRKLITLVTPHATSIKSSVSMLLQRWDSYIYIHIEVKFLCSGGTKGSKCETLQLAILIVPSDHHRCYLSLNKQHQKRSISYPLFPRLTLIIYQNIHGHIIIYIVVSVKKNNNIFKSLIIRGGSKCDVPHLSRGLNMLSCLKICLYLISFFSVHYKYIYIHTFQKPMPSYISYR